MRNVATTTVRAGLLAILFLCPALAAAQPADAGDRPPGGQEPTAEGYLPPALSGGTIDLVGAVRTTLANDPNLLLRAAEARQQYGRAEELAGQFDWTFIGEMTYEHREQELLESVKKSERDKRNQLADAAAIACDEQENLTLKVAELEAAQTMTGVDITSDRGFDAQLQLIEAALLAAPPEAQAALEQTRLNLIQTELERTREALAGATQACTDTTEGLDRLGDVPEDEEFDIGRLDLRLEKRTRSGVLWTPFLRGSYDSTNYVGKVNGFFEPGVDPFGQPLVSPSGIPIDRLIDFGGKNVEDVYTFEVGFEVNIPLLRNRGVDAVAATERAAKVDYRASELLLQHVASERALNTAVAFWRLNAAQERIAVLERSVELQQGVVEVTRALIDADELPGAELARALAGEANARSQLKAAERQLVTGRLDLVRAMGAVVAGQNDVPVAQAEFPSTAAAQPLARLDQALVDLALANRLDLAASRSLVESSGILARAAVINLRSKFDLKLGARTTARGESGFSQATDKWVAPSLKAEAAFEKPFGNRAALGRLAQSEARQLQRLISEQDLARTIAINVVRYLNSLDEAVDRVGYAGEAADRFEETIETELEKLRLGETTLLDTILTEQQRTNSQLSLIAARLDVATLLAQLRFETGTMVLSDETGNRITLGTMTSVPGAGDAS